MVETGTDRSHALAPDRLVHGVKLAESVTVVAVACCRRAIDAPAGEVKSLRTALKRELRTALRSMQQANIAPVDLTQAAAGPEMKGAKHGLAFNSLVTSWSEIASLAGRTPTPDQAVSHTFFSASRS